MPALENMDGQANGPASPTAIKAKKVWDVTPSVYADLCFNPIRSVVEKIKKPDETDKPLIPLSLGDPTVFGNLKAPDVLVNEVEKNLRSYKANGYVHSAGMENAREAIAKKFGTKEAPLTANDIIIASGCSGALEIALSGILNPGDNILLPLPDFALYRVICNVHKVDCKFYRLNPEKNWECDLEQMEAQIDGKTKAILVNNPSNPCGSVFSEDHLRKILAIAERHKLPIIADEIYGDMTFGANKFYPIASLTQAVPVVSVGGLAKQYLVPGWRVGWVMVHDRNNVLENLRTGYFKLSTLILGANSLVQSAIPAVLTPAPGSDEEKSLVEFKKDYMQVLEENANFTIEKLKAINGLKVVVPQGAMYVMVGLDLNVFKDIKDDMDFTQKLLNEESVFVLPGQCFQMDNFFRVVFSAPKEQLKDAYERMADFCKRHS